MSSIENKEKIGIDNENEIYWEPPVISSFLIDASGSMSVYRKEVIAGQREMLNTLRGSAKCDREALLVVQMLFSDQMKPLHNATKLSTKEGDDKVVILNENNYNPNGRTALYSSVFELLKSIEDIIKNDKKKGYAFTIGIITDGEDTQGGVDTKDIRTLIQYITNKEKLHSSVIIGLTNKDFTEEKLKKLKETLGFQEAISLSQDPKAVRRAFMMASQLAISGQK